MTLTVGPDFKLKREGETGDIAAHVVFIVLYPLFGIGTLKVGLFIKWQFNH